MSLDLSQADYVVVVQAPTPGWVVSLDRTADQYRHQAVFITLKSPDPAFLYPQSLVEQRIATSVATSSGVKVYARVLRFDAGESQNAYNLAAQSDGVLKRR